MDKNPYAGGQDGRAFGGPDFYEAPERTSALAVASLVLALICCIPPLPAVGVVLGVFGLISIGGSRGRLGGKGLAIAGIILGALFTFAQIGLALSMRAGLSQFVNVVPTYGQVINDIQNGDYDKARAMLTGQAAAMTDEELAAFGDAVSAELGAFASGPAGFMDMIGMYGPIAQQVNAVQLSTGPGPNQMVPMPGTFDRGPGIIGVPQSSGFGQTSDLAVSDADGPVIRLLTFDLAGPAAGTPGVGAAPSTAPDAQSGTDSGSEPGSEPGSESGADDAQP
jgi:hypothetical protein